MNIILQMAWEFFKTGLFAVGGGLATIPFLAEMGRNYGWFTAETLSTMIAVSESTPGPMGINMATYVGFVNAGVIGALTATLSEVAPSIIVISIIARALERFKQSKIVKAIFNGLRPAVVGLILSACMSLFLMTLFCVQVFQTTGNIFDLFNWTNLTLFVIFLVVYKKYKLNPILVIIIGAATGLLFKL